VKLSGADRQLREDVVVASELEFWRQDPATKAEGIAREVERLSRRARAAGLMLKFVLMATLGLATSAAAQSSLERGDYLVNAVMAWTRLISMPWLPG
jgi:hypothetical protein